MQKKKKISVSLKEGHCLQAYPEREAEGLNLPELIHTDRELDL